MAHKKLFIATILLLAQQSDAWQVIPVQLSKEEKEQKEKTRDTSKSFAFPVNAHFDFPNHVLTTAQQPNAKDFSVSAYDFLENILKPVAFEKVVVNGVKDQVNPLFNSAIARIALMNEHALVAALQSDHKQLFAVSLPSFQEVLSSVPIKDASGAEIDSPIGVLAGGGGYAFAAVKGNGQKQFGAEGSGIAVFAINIETKEIQLTDQQLEELKKEVQEKADEKSIEQFSKEITTKDGKHTRKVTEKKFLQMYTAPLSVSSDCIKIGGNAAALEIMDMHWNDNLKRLYIAVQVKGNEQETDGVCGLVVGRIDGSGKLVLSPLIKKNLVSSDQNQIVAGKASNAEVTIQKVRSMLTSTFLNYLIVLGGNGCPASTQSSIFAVPLLNFHTQEGIIAPGLVATHGTLADTYPIPLEGFSATGHAHLFLGRHFIRVPKLSSDLPTNQTQAVLVGGGPVSAGPIDEIFVKDDAVYAIVADSFEGQSAGIYYSHPIYDENGRIAAWTAWQPKALLPDETITGAHLDRICGSLLVATGNDHDCINTIKRTQWTTPGFAQMVDEKFPQTLGGVHGLVSFPANTPGLGGDSALAILGLGVAVFMQDHHELREIRFKHQPGAASDLLSPFITAEIISYGQFQGLVAGDTYGIAYSSLTDDCGFERIGDYSFVRKIIADEQFLYILTDTVFDRIDLNSSNFSTGQLSSTRLADIKKFDESGFGIFIDMIISEKCAVLATSSGLYRIGDNQDIRTHNFQTITWKPLTLYDSAGQISALISISISGRSQDVARGPGQMYVITGSMAKNTAHLHRFAVFSVINKAMCGSTILPLRDFSAINHQSYYANIGNFTSIFATDGSLFFTQGIERRKKMKKAQIINNSFNNNRRKMPLQLGNDAIITCIARDYATGNWIIGGDFGLIVNE